MLNEKKEIGNLKNQLNKNEKEINKLSDENKEINKKIANFQKQCKHLQIDTKGKCCYCGKQIENIRNN